MLKVRNIGRFLLGILTDLGKWAEDEQLFMQDNRTKIGGKVTYLPGFMQPYARKPIVAIEDLMKWKELRKIHKKWHRKLTNVRCFRRTPSEDT